MQFGFGFYYKGMDRAIDAINYLKQKDSKFKDIYYCCLISTNGHNSNIHDDYYKFLIKKIEDLELQNNVTIHIGFFSNEVLNCFLRTAKIALFPYKIDSNNTVYGASGAIRIAMANNIPVIASESHLFDDLQDVVARPKDCVELAKEIDEIFSNENYRKDLQEKQKKFIKTNNWKSVSYKYIELYYSIHEKMYNNHVELCE
jgi:glycosyltransferase involved in cell wall biosynthesis